jgi:dTDP-glucose 4,6-dehydratase
VGSGKGISIGELAETVLAVMHLKKPVTVDQARIRPVNSEVFTLLANNAKAAATVGWTPRHSLQQGLAKTIEFVSGNLDLYKSDSYAV